MFVGCVDNTCPKYTFGETVLVSNDFHKDTPGEITGKMGIIFFKGTCHTFYRVHFYPGAEMWYSTSELKKTAK